MLMLFSQLEARGVATAEGDVNVLAIRTCPQFDYHFGISQD